jgi:hypothetical protein
MGALASLAPGSDTMNLHCWKFVTNDGLIEDRPGGDVVAPGKSIHELFRLGWETLREDLTDGGTLVCLRFRESAPARSIPQQASVW